jgi:hypothetical protein
MNCEQAKPFLYDRALGETTSPELDRHLASCADCRTELADLELTRKLMLQGLPEEEPARRIAFVAEKPTPSSARAFDSTAASYNPLRFWQWSFAGAAALALLFAVLAVRHPVAAAPADTFTRAEVEALIAKSVSQAVNASEQRQQAETSQVIQSAAQRMAEQFHYLESTQTQVYRQTEQNRADLRQVDAIIGRGQGVRQ